MQNGCVSIIMPVYNAEKYIRESINSVLAQSYQNWELLMTDDGSTDESRKILEEYAAKDHRIKIFFNEENKGPAGSRNVSLSHVNGEYVAFLDSDDLWSENKLESQLKWMKDHSYAMTATSYELIDAKGHSIGERIVPPDEITYERMLYLSCPIGNSTVIYDRKVVGDIQVPLIKKRNDFALWLKILKKSDIMVRSTNKPLTYYRKRDDSISANKLSLMKFHWQLYRKIEHLNIFKSIFAMICWMVVKVFHIAPKHIKLNE